MDITAILKEAFLGSLSSMIQVVKIVIPLMLTIEIINDLKLLDRISKIAMPLVKLIGTSKYSIIPLLSGLIFGLLYGAGIIIDSVKEGNMDSRDVKITIIFLAACHAVFEDTLLFVQFGVNGWIVFFSRLISAFLVTFIASKSSYINKKESLSE